MRFSMMAGWFYSVMRVLGEIKRGADGCTNRDAVYDTARDPDCAKLNLQTLAAMCRSSHNAVKMLMDTGILLLHRANWLNGLLQASQNLSLRIARTAVARKEQREFRGEGGVVGNEPGMRFAPSGLRLLYTVISVFLLGAFLPQHADAQTIRVDAKILWQLNGSTNAIYQTKEEAFDAAQAFWAARPLDAWILTGLHHCGTPRQTFNGKPAQICGQGTQVKTQDQAPDFYVADGRWVCGVGFGEPVYSYTTVGNDQIFKIYCEKTISSIEPDPKMCVGNPTLLTRGVKEQTETDYASPTGLSFSHKYRSNREEFSSILSSLLMDKTETLPPPTPPCYDGAFKYKPDPAGGEVTQRYCFPYTDTNPTTPILYKRDDGYFTQFTAPSGTNNKPANINIVATKQTSAQGEKTWRIQREDDSVEVYIASPVSRISRRTFRGGYESTFGYSPLPPPSAGATSPGLLAVETDSFGRALQFQIDTFGLLSKMIDPAGREYDYVHDGNGNLISVTYPPDGSGGRKTKTYHYEMVTKPKLLTGITDENGKRFATYAYNSEGQVTETKHFAAPGLEVNKYQLSYPGGSQTTAIDPLNTSRTYNYTNILGYDSVVDMSQPCGGCGGGSAQKLTYDANRNIESRIDFNGNKTCYKYDLPRNLESNRIEGLPAGADCTASFAAATLTAPARKVTTSWHPSFRLPTSITEPSANTSRITTFAHDAAGNILTRSINDSAANITRTQTYTYDAYGRVLTAKDARNNVTTNTYYPNTGAQNATLANSRGMLASTTNALGHVINYTAYDANGRVMSMTDANGLVTAMTYHPRGWLLSRTVGIGSTPETTTYDYDGVGQLTKVTLPDASFMRYTYDDAHRLIALQDTEGSKITYTLDAMGNRVAERAYDPASTLARSRTRVYDALNRLQKDIGATNPAAQVNQYGYDNQGNLTVTTDPLNHSNTSAYDALNRIILATDPNNGQTQYSYDSLDQLAQVKDAKNLNTTYTTNAFGEVVTQVSPDTGTTSFTYDAAGNLTLKTDARGATAKYVYDALNRVTQTKFYPTLANANANTSSDETRTYTFDSCTNGKGRLCTLVDKAGTTTFSYDLKGRITAKSQLVSSLTQSHSYRYNSAGQMDQWTTASGQIIGYSYANNKVSSITVNGAALIGNVLYDPFGPPVGWLWPSASTPALKTYRDYDLDGRLTRWELKNGVSYIQRDVVWDNANRVTQLKDLLSLAGTNPNNPQVFGYDALDRLTTTNLGTATTASQSLAYDAIGNRTSATINGIISTYNLPTTSHKLSSTTGGTNPRTFTYDAMGNLTNDGKYTYTYWNNGRINTVTWVTGTAPNTTTNTATYNINALGQRVRKVTPSSVVGTRRFMYDEAGHLAGEYDAAGKLVQETIWLGDVPIATLRPKSGSTTTPIQIDTFYVHADHLGTPRVITRPSDNKIVWSWDSTEAFGNNLPNENPSALGAFTYNLRMPGQYFDKETGTFYNHFRDYDSSTGRYTQSDPIGLDGGVSTFGYVGGMPLMYVDPYGLWAWGDPLDQGLVDFSAGFGDTLSFGLTNIVRKLLDTNGVVNKCSNNYSNGEWGAIGLSVAFGGAHLGRSAINQMGNGGLGRGLSRLVSDGRSWSSVQRTWSNTVGGYKGQYELHHWFTPQSLGGSNAAWNYLPTSRTLNNMMSNGGLLYNGFKGSVLGIYGAAPTSAIRNASTDCACGQQK